ncbi:metadherin a isoform X2 [Cynoglossus semilaevis]|uniref:Metadherin a n=1 Tax=Cynoglossus semilaevis TaxID=244447 RepID=A0A3P8WK06_CYNSE|nr:protein LYRIC-like isoform X2 [Cynoglossus semilaevis]
MAGDLKGFALEKAEMLSGRLKELLFLGQDYVHTRFGLDLGLKPDQYPTWVMVSSAAAGLLLLLALSWAALCGAVTVGKKRGSPVTQVSSESAKAGPTTKTAKAEEQKKRNKKKTAAEKAPLAAATNCGTTKSQSNGQPVSVAQAQNKVIQGVSKTSPKIKAEKVQEVQVPMQVKKNKKKSKTDVKPVQTVSTTDAKETDEGAWETKVSNREKRQQRRKDKGPEDSGSSGGVEAPKVTKTPVNTKKNKGNQESLPSKITAKVEKTSGSGKVSSNWREESSVNGVGWTDISLKHPEQMVANDRPKWRNTPTAAQYNGPTETQCWTQETQAWSGIDGGVKADVGSVSFSMQRRNNTGRKNPLSIPTELQWTSNMDVNDEWSAFNGLTAADPTSDWNAPAEHWGNYEEPPVLVTSAPPLKEQQILNKLSEDEKNAIDPSGGAAKTKRRRKKKKTEEEEATSEAQMGVSSVNQSQELPAMASKKQNLCVSSSTKITEQTVEPPKPSQKKKSRRET